MSKKELIQGANEVIISQNVVRFRGTLTPTQSRSMLAILKRANEQVAENPNIVNFTIPTSVFLDDIQNKDTAGTVVKKVHQHLRKLMVQTFEFGTIDHIKEAVFMQEISITNAEVTFVFSNYIREHIKPISNALIIKDFDILQSFRSEYARQLYKHLMAWEQKQSCYLTVKDFKDFLGVSNTNTSYERMEVLKRKVLNVAIAEINEKCPWMDLRYGNRTKKGSKSIEGFSFGWFNKPKEKQNQTTKQGTFDLKLENKFDKYYGKNVKINSVIHEHIMLITPLTDDSFIVKFENNTEVRFINLTALTEKIL